MGPDELKAELERQRDYLADFEETFCFTSAKTSAHISAGMFGAIAQEHEEERKAYIERIERLERLLREKTASS